MKNLCKGLAIALVATACGVISAPKATAQAIVQTDVTTLDSNPIVLSQPAVIETTPVMTQTVLSAPAVINSGPMLMPAYGFYRLHRHHFLDLGVPGLVNFSLF